MCFRGFTIARRYPARNSEVPSACSSSPRLLADLLEPRRVAVPSRAAWSAVVFRRIEVEPLRLRDCPMNGARTDRTGGAEQDGRDRFEEIVAALDRDRRSRLKNVGQLVIAPRPCPSHLCRATAAVLRSAARDAKRSRQVSLNWPRDASRESWATEPEQEARMSDWPKDEDGVVFFRTGRWRRLPQPSAMQRSSSLG
jgi:hypothetical protein